MHHQRHSELTRAGQPFALSSPVGAYRRVRGWWRGISTPAIQQWALLPLAAGLLAIVASACGGGADASAEATIAIRFSRFAPEAVEVPAGVPVTITLRNDDPIEHEWIIGPPDVHDRHRTGTEPYHDAVPTEVTIPALESRTTTITFERPGEYLYICHLPGHEAYGMVGRLFAVDD